MVRVCGVVSVVGGFVVIGIEILLWSLFGGRIVLVACFYSCRSRVLCIYSSMAVANP